MATSSSRPLSAATFFRLPPLGPLPQGFVIAVGMDGEALRLQPAQKEEVFASPLPPDPALMDLLTMILEGKASWVAPLPPEIRPFDREVLEAVRRIPFGATASYSEVSRALGRARASRAVGGALARNPLLLLIPCHRVVRGSGETGGYAGGAELKGRILAWEKERKE